MKKLSLLVYVFFIFMAIGGCANTQVADKNGKASTKTAANDPAASQKSAAEVIDGAIAKADLAYKANKPDEAAALLKEVATAYPLDKQPWKRLAQAGFDAEDYGNAIVYALEVLKRDPKDQVASSIVVVSGLRVSTKSLADLRSQNEISGTLKTEAIELAKILSENLGEPVLVAKQHKPVYRKRKYQKTSESGASKSTAPSKSADLGNPFGVLK